MKSRKILFAVLLFLTVLSESQNLRGEQTATLAIAEVQTTPILTKRNWPVEPGAPQASPLQEILEAINNQLTDQFQTMTMFKIVEPGELRRITGRTSPDAPADAASTGATGLTARPTTLVGTYNGSRMKHCRLSFDRVESAATAPAVISNDPGAIPADLKGEWHGTLSSGDSEWHLIMYLDQNADGTYRGSIKEIDNEGLPGGAHGRKSDPLKQIEYKAPWLLIKWGVATFTTELNPKQPPVTRTQVKLAQPVVYDFKDPKTTAQFRQAGIKYLAVLMLEDFDDQTLDLMQGRATFAKNNSQATKGGYSSQSSGVSLDSNVRKQQTVRAAVRCRLYDATTGALLKSENRTFTTNRVYVALAHGNNEKSTGDLYLAAAHDIAAWMAVKAGETAFPIQVLEKNKSELTINRGSDTGIQVGQVYTIEVAGKEIKDPDTGEVLGREEIPVGKAAIDELHPKFSKARILYDSGIENGAVLRPATTQ